MTPGNFNWFLHAMLFYHTKYVLRKQKFEKQNQIEDGVEEDENLGLDEGNADDFELDEDEIDDD